MTDQIITPMDPLEEAKKGMRLLRNVALGNTDFMLLADAKLPTGITIDNVTAYRQYLRDLPNNATTEEFMTFKGVLSLSDWVAAQ